VNERRRSPGAPPCAARLLAVEQIDLASPRGLFAGRAAVGAAEFLAGHAWGRGFRRLSFGAAVNDVAACFLAELDRPVGPASDRWVWVVAGRAPSAYFVTDRAPEAAAALGIYCELARDWLRARAANDDAAVVFPLPWPDDVDGRARLAVLLDGIERVLALPVAQRAADPAWLDADGCPQRPRAERSPGGAAPAPGGLRPGLLVSDHRGDRGILLEPHVPTAAWLAQLRDDAMRCRGGEPWWRIAFLSGGSGAMPASLLAAHGPPGEDDIRIALANANEFGKRTIRAVLDADRGAS
jgi:hypothetical protein